MDTIFFFLRFLDVSCCFENSLFLGIAKVHFEIIQMYSIVVNRGDDRNARSDFCRTSGYRVRQIRIYTVTVFDSSWNEVAGKKRAVSWRAIANQRARLDSPFPSRPVTATPVFLRFRGEYEITLIEYRHNWALKTR